METAESHLTRWARLLRKCRSKQKLPPNDETHLCQLLFVVRPCGTDDSDWRPVGCSCTNTWSGCRICKKNGFAMPRSTYRGLEVGTGSGSECGTSDWARSVKALACLFSLCRMLVPRLHPSGSTASCGLPREATELWTGVQTESQLPLPVSSPSSFARKSIHHQRSRR